MTLRAAPGNALAAAGIARQEPGMKHSIFTLGFVAAMAATPAFANPDSAPVACSGPELRDEEPYPASVTVSPGLYRCSEEGVTITLRLDANGRFEERMTADEPMFEREGGGMENETTLAGQWRLEGTRLHFFARPLRAPKLALAEARRDPAVELRIEVMTPDGKPAQGLFVGEGQDANPRSSLDDGVLTIPKGQAWQPGTHWIVRDGNELRLVSFAIEAGGPNSFRYVYEPSEVEPFDQRGMVAGAHGEVVVVPLGIGGAALRRVDAAR
ncbi:hypothetical protein TQ38_018585 [Novosphingobium sp. P6W]|nr:hypothetical protein TQ38_018585 [Novosphingobium sp. P6W]